MGHGNARARCGGDARRDSGYCSDDATAWFDWSALERHADVHRFVRELIGVRTARTLPIERLDMTLNELLAQNRIDWHGVQLDSPDWGEAFHSLAAALRFDADGLRLHLMMNASWEPLAFALPALEADCGSWRRCVDTFRASPADLRTFAEGDSVSGPTFTVQPRSLAGVAARSAQFSRGANRFASVERNGTRPLSPGERGLQ